MKAVINLLLITALISNMAGCKQQQAEIYLIPQGFKGKVNIIFNQDKGVGPKYEDGKRLYEIPITGVLLTQFKDEYGLVNRQYFYVNSNGKRMRLKKLEDDAFSDTTSSYGRDEVGIFYDGTTGVYGNSNDPKALRYQEFTVSDFNSLNSFYKPENQADFKRKLKETVGYEF
jgi:hypothetical protein